MFDSTFPQFEHLSTSRCRTNNIIMERMQCRNCQHGKVSPLRAWPFIFILQKHLGTSFSGCFRTSTWGISPWISPWISPRRFAVSLPSRARLHVFGQAPFASWSSSAPGWRKTNSRTRSHGKDVIIHFCHPKTNLNAQHDTTRTRVSPVRPSPCGSVSSWSYGHFQTHLYTCCRAQVCGWSTGLRQLGWSTHLPWSYPPTLEANTRYGWGKCLDIGFLQPCHWKKCW